MAQCIEPDVDSIAGYVRQRKQLRIAAHDLRFMLLAIFADSVANGLRQNLLRDGHGAERTNPDTIHRFFQHGSHDKVRSAYRALKVARIMNQPKIARQIPMKRTINCVMTVVW